MRRVQSARRTPRTRREDLPPPVPTVSADQPAPPDPETAPEADDEAIRRMIEAAYT